jgi:hypothetical protein
MRAGKFEGRFSAFQLRRGIYGSQVTPVNSRSVSTLHTPALPYVVMVLVATLNAPAVELVQYVGVIGQES